MFLRTDPRFFYKDGQELLRAYRELSHEGFLESRRGEGNFISETAKRNARDGLEAVRERLQDGLRQARAGGLGWNEIEKLTNKAKGEEK